MRIVYYVLILVLTLYLAFYPEPKNIKKESKSPTVKKV